MISIQGKYELKDLTAAQALHTRFGLLGRVVIVITMALFILPIAWELLHPVFGKVNWPLVISPVIFLVLLALVWFGFQPYQVRHIYRQQKELSAPFEMELNDTGYALRNEYGSGLIPWKDFIKYKEDKKVILLYRTDVMFNLVPKRMLQDESQVQFIHEQLEKNGVKEARKVKSTLQLTVRTAMWVVVILLLGILVYINIR